MTKQIADEAMKGPIMTDYMQKAREALAPCATWDEELTLIAHTFETLDTERAAHDATKAELRVMREALRYYGHQFCELGESHECCGRLSKDECSGCFARQTLTRKEA
jgi:hypothetical protein